MGEDVTTTPDTQEGPEFPLVAIDNNAVRATSTHCPAGSFVACRLCEDDKTYLGVYAGEQPVFAYGEYDAKTKVVTVDAVRNCCIVIPSLGRIVYGHECWWERIDSPEDLRDITDEDVLDVWYVREALEAMGGEAQDG